jgi:hypothetical protein
MAGLDGAMSVGRSLAMRSDAAPAKAMAVTPSPSLLGPRERPVHAGCGRTPAGRRVWAHGRRQRAVRGRRPRSRESSARGRWIEFPRRQIRRLRQDDDRIGCNLNLAAAKPSGSGRSGSITARTPSRGLGTSARRSRGPQAARAHGTRFVVRSAARDAALHRAGSRRAG